MAKNVLANKDVNAAMAEPQTQNMEKDVKSMEYHRQVFQSKMAENETYAPPKPKLDADPRRNGNVSSKDPLTCCDRNNKYISPSDNIMSPCTAKINALRNKHASKVKPKSLFAQASAKKLQGENPLGATPIPASNAF